MNVINFYKKSTNLIIKIIIGFYVICFMIASINHIVPFITGRLFVYQKSNVITSYSIHYTKLYDYRLSKCSMDALRRAKVYIKKFNILILKDHLINIE